MLKKRRIINYLITLLVVMVGLLSIQFKWFFDEIIEDEKEAQSQISTAVCRAFGTIANEDKISGTSTRCANLGGGEFEIHTGAVLSSIDSVVRQELLRADKIVPFKVTTASQESSPSLSFERGQITGGGDFYQMAHLDVAIPSRSRFFVSQIDESAVLYFVFVSLIGVVFYNVFKSVKEERQYPDDASDHKKDNTYSIGRYTFDSRNQVLSIGQTERRITKKENQVLQLLCSKKNQIVRRDDILAELWGENDYFKGRSLDVFVARLRKYLSGDKNIRIETIYGVGFVLNDD